MPNNWELVLNNIRQMRSEKEAPVDVMGCDKCSDESAPPEVTQHSNIFCLDFYYFIIYVLRLSDTSV